jgi:hypothetical protein
MVGAAAAGYVVSGDARKQKIGFLEWLDVSGAFISVNNVKLEHLKQMFNLSVFAFKHYSEIMNVIEAYPFTGKNKNDSEIEKLLKEPVVYHK